MKKYVYLIVALILLGLCFSVYKYYKESVKYKELYKIEQSNVEAYANEKNKDAKDYKQFQLTIDELKSSKDSINQKLLEVTESLKIKPKNIHTIEYSTAIISKTDTIKLQGDTIFRYKAFDLDTCLGDQWYKIGLHLQYPSTIITSPKFNSEKYVIVNTKKEYVRPRSKIFFIRWFQKRKKVVTVDVVEKNPYITNGNYRHIEILK